MNDPEKQSRAYLLLEKLKEAGKITKEQEEYIQRELHQNTKNTTPARRKNDLPSIYDFHDVEMLLQMKLPFATETMALQTLDELLEQDKKRVEDGFPRRIRLGKLVKPSKNEAGKVVIVPTTIETKFYHDDSITQENEQTTGGVGEGQEGQVLGETPIDPQQGEGEGTGAGQGKGAEHDMGTEAFDLGRVLTEKFELPNLKKKGRKLSTTKYRYDLTDKNEGFGQILDKKSTLKKIIQTNILLDNISKENQEINTQDLIFSPKDKVFRILSKEKDYEAQAVVFFLRDYSGSMDGEPSEVVTSQHLFIYSWLMFQYKKNVIPRFILHDTEAKEVPDFYNYYKSKVAGGTNVFPAYQLVNQIIEDEALDKMYNIYVFHGTDGDDWDNSGEQTIDEIKKTLQYVNRLGITVAKNSWVGEGTATVVERYMEKSGLLQSKADVLRLDSLVAAKSTENRIVEGIKRLVAE